MIVNIYSSAILPHIQAGHLIIYKVQGNNEAHNVNEEMVNVYSAKDYNEIKLKNCQASRTF